MTTKTYKQFYSQFLEKNPDVLHFASHSHYYWPDCTRQAVIDCWEDSARLVDHKWPHFFEHALSKACQHISNILGFNRPSDIAFANNTHELLDRLFSCLDHKKTIRLLTSDCEFHSFKRQLLRWQETLDIDLTLIESEDINQQLPKALEKEYDFIFLSSGFFLSGLQLQEEHFELLKNKGSGIICIDGYHSFCATDFKPGKYLDHFFYLSGGYKYAQAGEGMCFLTLPKNCELRPMNTGWFAHFESLEKKQTKVEYSNNGMRFWGATYDFTAIYRFNAVWDLFKDKGISVQTLHEHVKELQAYFIKNIELPASLLNDDLEQQGSFLTYEFKSEADCQDFAKKLLDKKIHVDYRSNRLRFGFALYIDKSDIDELKNRLNS